MNRIGVLAMSLVCLMTTLAYAQSPTQRISGDVVSLDGLDLRLKSDSGQSLTVTLAKDFTVSARSRADAGAIKLGAFLGTTAAEHPDGTLIASEVHVFPESMRGTGEGHRPMAPRPGSTMTNATVASVSGAKAQGGTTMTNATAADVAHADRTRRMTLKYKGGEKVVIVPENVPVVMVEPGDRSLLIPGAHIVVTTTTRTDGALVADRVIVGKDGLVPPS